MVPRKMAIPRETFVVVFYSAIEVFKVFFLVFNLVPYMALLIVGMRVKVADTLARRQSVNIAEQMLVLLDL